VNQVDSVLYLPKGFAISKESKFRNQQVLVVLEVPVGKAIRIDRSIDWYQWFNIDVNRRGLNINVDDDFYNDYSWRNNVWYVMTENGLERIDGRDKDSNEEDNTKEEDWKQEDGQYRYRRNRDTIDIKIDNKDTTVNIKLSTEARPKEGDDEQPRQSVLAASRGNRVMGRHSLISVLDLLKIGR
jgi:hypothetical protein